MTKDAVFTFHLDVELHDAFMAAAKDSQQSASQILRDMMRDFVRQQATEPEYTAFLQRKVDAARSQISSGEGLDAIDVEQEFAARRAAVAGGSRSRS
ncbi:antitoxin of toxin-antitoxin stability system [Pseudorhizobium endolithicum]|uniref:Antitoxin of toxin-antitoxin stability system n=2 Tax=Pseudorhizobium endolithicum TaxID=1191678 RepID=A0ABM8PX48_9HYPH|nr:antitoxin of toxin-antitoxin stability system [Pseudorhizobium endolithicum]